MKLKYILGMIAGLVTLTATSCKESTSVDAGATGDKSVATADSAESEELAGAYYVTFLGDGS